jgi:hypothetical protein
MTYLCWGVAYEGSTDEAYLDVLIPRLMEAIVVEEGVRNSTIPTGPSVRLPRGSIETVAERACSEAEAYHLMFFHEDTGGRALEAALHRREETYCAAMHRLCEWPIERCILIQPRHETEAWILADAAAILDSLGFNGAPAEIGLPADAIAAERLADPKATLEEAVRQVRGRRSPLVAGTLFAAVALRQDFAKLRRSRSFRRFEQSIRIALASLGAIAPT